MPKEIYLVKVGMNMTEGVVEEWYIADGATVDKGELLYRLETEKVNLDVDAETSGTVKHLVGEGVTMKPGDVVGYIYAADETIPDVLPQAQAAAAESVAESAPVAASPARPAASSTADGRILSSPAARRLAGELNVDIAALNGSGPGGRIVEADVQAAADAAQPAAPSPSSPMARKLARELGVDLAQVRGTGPGGRITKDDVERAAAAPPAPAAAPVFASGEDRVVPVRGMRKTIATRMFESLQSSAQLTMDMDANMDDAVKLRNQLVDEWQDEGVRPTYTDLVIRAAAKALEKHPLMNSVFGETEMTLRGDINVGMAVALEEGLIVPVVRHANRLSMKELARESARLAEAAREGTLTPDDLQDGTFTVSALGMFGVDAFTPIINAPQSGILGVNRLRDDLKWVGEVPMKTQVMRLSLTWDHRALDGAPAAQFLATVRELLEAPFRLLV
ncbi:MAG: 2-oxo acid dehydrogenase subunit E2 [Gammaproteobacteria bacterium]|nr:2-oxo acid dehydrogenase subunit E2 [Gammaproteobacteria bacterium]MXW49896.1 2-oxo acid dehydrogenase subunit E2 [Gammaproteobacteria bacterium]MYE53371.1 2-oxo acid dehydrogenase subunit E2 [Gammaproteobacteria bacterium]MYF10571.1 2-oxo acid dehydrogenase subunit E2 [Gammaproteobacteria bacterium]MYF50115.1 2-oxo acid dehydrogenase subunit E2 [Gammaproteobacteria bacterium]